MIFFILGACVPTIIFMGLIIRGLHFERMELQDRLAKIEAEHLDALRSLQVNNIEREIKILNKIMTVSSQSLN